MKFFHTADWHLGNRMHDIDRTEEVRAFFCWLRGKIVGEGAEALVIAGDIFDTANPSNEARTMYHDFLCSLLGTCCKNVVIVGGNHDSGMLLDSEKSLLRTLNIFVVGSAANLEPADMVFELKNGDGEAVAVCAAVPFLRESELRRFYAENPEDGTFCDRAYGALYEQVCLEAEKLRAGKNIPLIATGHLYAANLEGRFENFKKEVSCDDGRRMLDVVGKLGCVHRGIFPEKFDYVALGHIHYSTRVAQCEKIRYSGSPFVMGFDEAAVPRVVLSVEAEKGSCSVKKIQVPRTVEFRRVSGDCETIRRELEKYLEEKPLAEKALGEKPLEKETLEKKSLEKMPLGELVFDFDGGAEDENRALSCKNDGENGCKKSDEKSGGVFLEIYYKKEAGINIHDELEELINRLEEKNVYVVSRRVQESGEGWKNSGDYFDMEEMASLKPEKVFESFILSKCQVLTEGKSSEEVEKEKKEFLNTFLPVFVECFEKMESEGEF